ncbi:MAG: sugar-binding protein [Spirochaetes bacterium]|nr:sugar-binding protein [Spirochaetota bacterium]
MKKMRVQGIMAALVLAAGMIFTSCGGGQADSGYLIGVAMPTRSSARWISDGENVQRGLEALGFSVDLQFADDVIETQVAQIENMIMRGARALVIGSIDGAALTGVLQQAADAGIPVIAYDRLLMNSPHVNYYVSFDNFRVGMQMGEIMVRGLDLENATPDNPRFIEVFGGSPDDNNAFFFYDGAMVVLQPFIDAGTLVIGSGQRGMHVVGTLRWDGALAQARMDNLLSAFYTEQELHGVLSPYDGLSLGIISSLRGVGFGTDGRPMPIVGGQDALLPSIRAILDGDQYATIFKDTRLLADAAVSAVAAILEGRPVAVNNTTDYHNGVRIVPSILLDTTPIFQYNAVRILVEETGYYTLAQLGL